MGMSLGFAVSVNTDLLLAYRPPSPPGILQGRDSGEQPRRDDALHPQVHALFHRIQQCGDYGTVTTIRRAENVSVWNRHCVVKQKLAPIRMHQAPCDPAPSFSIASPSGSSTSSRNVTVIPCLLGNR